MDASKATQNDLESASMETKCCFRWQNVSSYHAESATMTGFDCGFWQAAETSLVLKVKPPPTIH